MSDSDEYEYEYDSDEQFDSDEEAGAAGSGEDEEAARERNTAREAQIALENTFYEAEDFRQRGDLGGAIEYFARVVALEKEAVAPEARKWSFQAYEKMVKICVSRRQWDDMLANYEKMLAHLAFVTRNESTDSISSILDVVSAATGQGDDKDSAKFTSKMYELTLERLKDVNNDRLWFSMNVKLGKLYLDMGAFDQLQHLLDQLYGYCKSPDGVEDHSKATSLLDVYALEIQLCGVTKNSSKMQEIYPKTLDLDAAIADPRVMGVIREEGGKMYLAQKEWMLAYNEFFESFRNYQEAGNSRATQCLKYVVLANMLASSDINPFDSREAKVYQDVEEIGAMLLLRGAYESNDIVQFEKVLKNPKYGLLSDPIMTKYLNPLLLNIRSQVMKKLVRPYQSIRLNSLSQSMNISPKEVEGIAVALIQNLELEAKIDQSRGLLVLQRRQKTREASKMYDALDRWTKALDSTHTTIAARVVDHS